MNNLLLSIIFIACMALSSVYGGGLFRNTGEDPGDILARAEESARPYAAVARLEIGEAGGVRNGTAFLVGRNDRELWLLTAKHCVMEKAEDIWSLELTFTLENGNQIKCFPLLAFIPSESPLSIGSQEKENDIALLKCVLSVAQEFNIQPLLMANSAEEESFLNRYEGQFVGYGGFGMNGSDALKSDTKRRLGETYVAECKRGDKWSVVSPLPGDKKRADNSFDETKEKFFTHLVPVEEGASKGHLHPRQAMFMAGDSGSPLIIKDDGTDKVIGIACLNQNVCKEERGAGYISVVKEIYSWFTPLRFYRPWVDDVIAGVRSDGRMLMPKLYSGCLKGFSLELVTKKGTKAVVSSGFGTHFPESYDSKPNISFNSFTSILNVEGTEFDYKSYNSIESATQDLLKSGLFEVVEFTEDAPVPMSLLSSNFIQACDIFMRRIDLYTEAQKTQGFDMLRARYNELKAHGLSDGSLPEKVLAAVRS